MLKASRGFTIVELLIVIVIIAILAAITIVAYNGINDRARTSKIESDLAALNRAIMTARISSGDVALRFITGSTYTAGQCASKASGTDLAALPQSDPCWVAYNNTLTAISNASSMNVRQLVDPWGRPYRIDENEQEGAGPCGLGKDSIGVFSQPFVTGGSSTNTIRVPYVTPGC